MSKAKVIQYGDEYPNVFPFSPFNEEEDWGDTVDLDTMIFSQDDGVYDFDDGETKKESKIITKRFTLMSSQLYEKYITQKEKYNNRCDSKQGYLTLLKDAFYRSIREERGGKLKRLYVQMEDGSIRWIWAKPQGITYSRIDTDQNDIGLDFDISFLCPEPYFYELNDGVNFYYPDFDLSYLVFPCSEMPEMTRDRLMSESKVCQQSCDKNGLIIRDESQIGYIGDQDCFYPACVLDPCQAYLGEIYTFDEDTDIDICVDGSAGAQSPYISLRDNWENPQILNSANGNFIKYNGIITQGQFVEIDLSSSETGDIEDYYINTNIVGFDINDLEMNIEGLFLLETNINTLELTGVTGSATFTINYLNKYHN